MTPRQLQDNRARIGQRIAQLRQERNLTQQQVADATGLLRPNIARLENGRYNVGIDVLAKVLIVLECDIQISPK